MSASLCPACLQTAAGFAICPHCGWRKGEQTAHTLHLSPGTVIKSPYSVARVLGYGGFGITYLGWDAHLAIKVAIKEYLPREFAMRAPGSMQVLPISPQAQSHFHAGLNQFLDEARTLAKFRQHPGIVSVLSFFPANGTGYMVMEYVQGETLKSYIQRRGCQNWCQTLEIFMHVMDALRAVHGAGLLHRDIAPDNVYLCSDGRIQLLDFGAAQLSRPGSPLKPPPSTILIKPGFAPAEQYQDIDGQGPWSDVYGVAASMYYCLTGQAPPDALDRLSHDSLSSPSALGALIPARAEQVLLGALAINAAQRPQTMASLQNQFLSTASGSATAELAPPDAVAELSVRAVVERLAVFQGWPGRLMVILLLLLLLFWLLPARQARFDIAPVAMPDDTSGRAVRRDFSGQPYHEETMLRAREQERRAAEELKQRQIEALKRFEESARRESQPVEQQSRQQDPSYSEHLRSLCAEWGATMDCKDLR